MTPLDKRTIDEIRIKLVAISARTPNLVYVRILAMAAGLLEGMQIMHEGENGK